MRRNRLCIVASIAFLAGVLPVCAQIVLLGSFKPANIGSPCGLGRDPITGNLWVYPANGDSIFGFTPEGVPVGAIARPGEASNDADITFAHITGLEFAGANLAKGTMLFINGESGVAEIYAIDVSTGMVLDTLTTGFGAGHVVGGGYHGGGQSIYLVQDNQPSKALRNRIALVNSTTGDTLKTFGIDTIYDVNYGDLEVSTEDETVYVVSTSESDTVLRVIPVNPPMYFKWALPDGVQPPTGLALDCAVNEAWVVSLNGTIYHLGQFPCGLPASVPPATAHPFRVAPAQPNPFDTRTAFAIEASYPQWVRVALYDLLGQEIDVIHEGMVSTGEHTITVEGDLPGGLYVIRVDGEEFTELQQVVRR